MSSPFPRDEYLAIRKEYAVEQYEAYKSLDKAILTLSSGALTFSIAFLQNIGSKSQYQYLLISSWLFLLLSITATIYGFFVSIESFNQIIRELDAMQEGKVLKSKSDQYRKQAEWVAAWSASFFVLGFGLLVIFGCSTLASI